MEPIIRQIPQNLKPLTDEEFELAMDTYFNAKMTEPLNEYDEKVQRILLTLDAERKRVGQLRHWLAHAGHNMKKPQTELTVLNTAVEIALYYLTESPDKRQEGSIDRSVNVLNMAIMEVAMSMAGKLDLDVMKWATMQSEAIHSKGHYGEASTLKPNDGGSVGFGLSSVEGAAPVRGWHDVPPDKLGAIQGHTPLSPNSQDDTSRGIPPSDPIGKAGDVNIIPFPTPPEKE